MTSQTASPAANAELVRAVCRAFNAHDADECLARIAPDFIINLAELPEPMHGQDAWRQNFETMKHAFPDFQAHIDDIVAAQDKVAVRLRIRGTHQPGGQGLPGRGRQREPLGPAALAGDRDLAGPPVDVAELQPGGLGASQAQPGQQRQDRVVPQAHCRVPVAAVQQPADLRGLRTWTTSRNAPLKCCRASPSSGGAHPGSPASRNRDISHRTCGSTQLCAGIC
jgi:predicted ester cyclase